MNKLKSQYVTGFRIDTIVTGYPEIYSKIDLFKKNNDAQDHNRE